MANSFKKSGVILRLVTIVMISLAVNDRILVDGAQKGKLNYTNLILSIKINLKALTNLSMHLKSACPKRFSSQDCALSKEIKIPGFDRTWPIRKNGTQLKDEHLLAECKKRLTVFSYHFNEVQKHEASMKRIKVRVKNCISWLTKLQKKHGFSTAVSMKRPAKLSSTGAKTDLDWYRIAIQLLKNLKTDFQRMKMGFKKQRRLK